MGYTDRASEPSAAVFGKVLACVSPVSISADILETVAEMLGAESGVYLRLISTPSDSCHVGDGQYLGSRPQALKAYVDGLYELDPVIRPMIRLLDEHPPRVSQATFTSFDREYLNGDPYAETFLKPYDIGHVMAIAIPVRADFTTQMACLGFHRSYGDAPFLPKDLTRLQKLTPALHAVFRGLASREALDIWRVMNEAIKCQRGDFSYLILGEDLTIRSASEDALGNAGAGKLELMEPWVLCAIKQELQIRPPAPGARRHFVTNMGDGSVIEIELRGVLANEARTYYLATRHGPPLQRSFGSVCEAFGFTERETEIARLVASGKQNASVAADLGISFRTVENHLRSIYLKSSVRTRTQLTSRLLSL